MFDEEISIVKIAWTPLYGKFIEVNAVKYPTVTHGDGFGFANSKTISSDSCSTFIIGDKCCTLLRITESSENGAFLSGSGAVDVEGSVFGFSYGAAYCGDTAADAM